jgi:hypothetical protein
MDFTAAPAATNVTGNIDFNDMFFSLYVATF